ncbi:MAG: HAMP domain-containing histidine kinase [Candidatus Portnoybacteria bacterium]|nr:HAMP domain-containing histidine kinase [Candidatus Portnoybacteria bacterium]
METIRTLILITGWPILIGGSIFLVYRSLKFYRDVGKIIWGKVVLLMVVGWLVSMYSLGITATAYMFDNVRNGVIVVLPIFFVWFITMVTITWAVLRWSKEAVTLSAFYRGLEELVKVRTQELKKAFEVQIEREKEIRRLQEQFVFIAAHELRTPVTAIEWGIRTMLEDEEFRKSLPEDYLRLLENLQEKNENLINLVADLLNVARLRNKHLPPEMEKVSLKEVLNEIKETVNTEAQKMKVRISWSALDRELPLVKAHTISLKEILTNLIVNAIRYNKPEGWVIVDAFSGPSGLTMEVKDGGIGMDDKEMEKLFGEFYRIKNDQTRNIEGTGLGLFICKELLERMQGKIWVNSSKGEGTTFSFSLPTYES